MMSERSKSINVSIPTSSSRLSSLARPFTIRSPFNRHESFDPLLGSSSSSTFCLDQPFPHLNLGDHRHHGYSAYLSDATAITVSPFVNDLDFELNSCFTTYPSEDPPVQTHFTPTSSSLGNNPVEQEQHGAEAGIPDDHEDLTVEPVHNETTNPYIMEKSKRQIACPNDHEDLTVEQHGAKAGIPDDKWSTNSDNSDVDSPCWKGTQTYKSPLRDSVPVDWEDCEGQSSSRVLVSLKLECSKKEKVAHNRLNPLAPVFIPGNSILKVDYHQKECQGDSFSFTENTRAFAVISSSREDGIRGSNKAGTSPSEEINDIGICCSYDVCDPIDEHGTPYESFRNSGVNSCCFQQYLGEECVTPESQLENVAGVLEGNADATCNALNSVTDIAYTVPDSSISFPTADIALNSHSIGDGVFSDLTERFQKPTKSTPPKLDAKLLINTIYYFQSCFYRIIHLL